MVGQADHVEWMVVGTEAEALLLEHNLIKQFQPRYNVRLKDDKSYPVAGPDRRATSGRGRPWSGGASAAGCATSVPTPTSGPSGSTLDLLLRSFPVRTCSDTKFRRHQRLGRPCLLYHIERCSGPCVGAVDHDEYDRMVADLDLVPRRRHRGRSRRELEAAMQEASERARLRAGLGAPGQARGRPGRRRRPPDGARAPRGPRRVRPGRGRAGGGRPGVPRPVGQGGRAGRPSSWTRSRT